MKAVYRVARYRAYIQGILYRVYRIYRVYIQGIYTGYTDMVARYRLNMGYYTGWLDTGYTGDTIQDG